MAPINFDLTISSKILRRLILIPTISLTGVACANSGSFNTYVIKKMAPAPSGYSAAVLAKRIVPLDKIDGA